MFLMDAHPLALAWEASGSLPFRRDALGGRGGVRGRGGEEGKESE